MRLAGRAARKDATSRNHVVAVQRKASARLSRRDWILAGQEILREHGVSGVKLAQLTRRLNVSTGSFYHHFANFDAYLGATAEAFSVDRVQGLLNRARKILPVADSAVRLAVLPDSDLGPLQSGVLSLYQPRASETG